MRSIRRPTRYHLRLIGLLADGSIVGAVFSQPDPVEGTARPAVEIAVIPPTGGSVHAIETWPGGELALARQDGLEAWIGERYRYAVQGPALEELKQDQRQIAQHRTTPRYGRIVGTADGGVAVGEFGLGTASPRTWIAVDPSGTVATITLTAGIDVKRWGTDWVVGVVRDALYREEVHRYRILSDADPGEF